MGNTFRKEYKPLSGGQKEMMIKVKETAEELERLLFSSTNSSNGREIAVAKTHLETAIMWAVKGITK